MEPAPSSSRSVKVGVRRTTQKDAQENEGFDEGDGEDELPPILEPPSTGYLHTVDASQPPPRLLPANPEKFEGDHFESLIRGNRPLDGQHEVIELRDSDEEGSTTATDSDDELVDLDYIKNPPAGFKKALKKYAFAIKKNTWRFNVKAMYKRQPTRIRRILKMHRDADGNPIEEPIEMLFEKIHAERERMRKAQNIKYERGEDPDQDVGPASVVKFNLPSAENTLTQILYPANVVNDEKAISTLGGIGNISKVFGQPNKKLVLRFRPNDPFANGANGQGRSTCGILVRVRRRKNAQPSSSYNSTDGQDNLLQDSGKINLDTQALGSDPVAAEIVHDILFESELKKADKEDNSVVLNDKVYRQPDLVLEDQIILEEKIREEKTRKIWVPGRGNTDCNLRIPKILETVPDRSTEIEALGIIQRTYDFNGICDFQYLPASKNADGDLYSVKEKIFPIFGAQDNPETLVISDLIHGESKGQPFSLPPSMSRIDNPPRGLMEELIMSEKADNKTKISPPDESIFSNRTKRIIYTISYNFQMDSISKTKRAEVPSQPLGLALADIERRQIKKELVEAVRLKFEERAIWSKVALEYCTKIPSQTLKYIIPHFAYFASNGPWRNTWIKFGLDPRKIPIHAIYQSVDFRIPFIYRRFMDSVSNHAPEAAHRFLPEHIPPKSQMFYQLCDIKLNEIKELIDTLKTRAANGTLVYDERYGFLKEGSFEYFRYIMTYYLENLLQEHGKIPATETPKISFAIPPGAIEPQEKMKAAPHRRVKQKRLRGTKKMFHNKGKTKEAVGKAKEATATRSNLETLEDLELNKLPAQSDSEEEIFYEDDEDEEEDDDDDSYE